MKTLLKKFNDMSLTTKLSISFFIAVIIPLLLLGNYLIYELRSAAYENAVSVSQANVERVKSRTSEVLKTAIKVSNQFMLDNQLKKILNTHYLTTFEIVTAYNNYDKFEQYLDAYKELLNIRIYMKNPTLISNWHIFQVEQDITEQFWYEVALESRGLINWYYIPDPTRDGEQFLSLVRSINYIDYDSSAVIVITINTDYLQEILNQEQSPLLLVDENNFVIASNRKIFIGKKLDEILGPDIVHDLKPGTYSGQVDGQKSEIYIDLLLPETSQNELKFISIIPEEMIMRDANRFVKLGSFVMSVSILIAIGLIFFFSRLLSGRFITLNNRIDQVAKGDFAAPIVIHGNDEIGQLSRQVDRMVKNILSLMNEVEQAQRENFELEKRQQEIRFKMLASQINPHFLFNTLESLRMKSLMKGNREIAEIIKKLGKLIRYSISVTGEMVTLQSEIEFVQHYLDIQKFRYGERLSYKLDIDPLSKHVLIHPLIIQPIVENAVIHGLQDKVGGGTVIIRTKVIDSYLHVVVQDDGIGIPADRLRRIQKSLQHLDENNGNRIGLINVNHRLIISSGAESSLNIESKENKGTMVSFKLPIGGRKDVQNFNS